jgi:hypothetical protein
MLLEYHDGTLFCKCRRGDLCEAAFPITVSTSGFASGQFYQTTLNQTRAASSLCSPRLGGLCVKSLFFPPPAMELPHVLGAQLIPTQSCSPFCAVSARHDSQPKLSLPLPIWRLFLFARKAHTLSHENHQARNVRPADASDPWR